MKQDNYHETRFAFDPKRDVVWASLWKYCFTRLIGEHDTVVDLGSGYGNFINHVKAGRRIAIDTWIDFPQHIAPGVETFVRDITDVDFLEDNSVDFAFASNIFEHIPLEDFQLFLERFRAKLSDRGTLNIIQPNYRYCTREYFDDYTHVAVYSHITMCDLLEASGYEVIKYFPKFLPLTVKSRFPVSPALIRLYLMLPVKPMGKQMFVRARRRK